MDNSGGEVAWRFGAVNPSLEAASALSIRALVHGLYSCVDRSDPRPLAPLGHGDPSPFACFRTAAAAEDAVAAAATSGKHNSYPTAAGLTEACRYVQHLSRLNVSSPSSFAPSDLSNFFSGINFSVYHIFFVLRHSLFVFFFLSRITLILVRSLIDHLFATSLEIKD